MATVKMNAASIGGTINLPNTGTVVVPADGIVTVDTRDCSTLLHMGASYISADFRYHLLPAAPRAATAGRLVASTALSNGTKTIANQPDVPRQGIVVIDPGTTAITAGSVAVAYTANDGSAQVDNISAVMPATTIVSTTTSKGIVALASVVVTGVAGGASPGVQLNDSNSLSLPVDPGSVDFSLAQTLVDGVSNGQVAVASSAASWTPSTAPNGTHTFGAFFGYNAPTT